MINSLTKFFNFCQPDKRKKFYLSIVLGVFIAILDALKIPASFVMISAVVRGNVTNTDIFMAVGLMAVNFIGSSFLRNVSTILQTEGGYESCANKRIEIAEHLRYLPMGYFNNNSLGRIASVTTNTMVLLWVEWFCFTCLWEIK